MRQKRGQISAFMILGMLILCVIIMIFFIRGSSYKNLGETKTSEILSFNDNVRSISNEVDICIEDLTITGLEIIANQGGYTEIPPQLLTSNTAYWYKEGVNFQPFLSEIGSQLSKYVEENLPFCTKPLFEERKEFNISASEQITSEAVFTTDSLFISVDYPIEIARESNQAKLTEFQGKINTNIWRLYDLATRIVNDASIPSFDKCNPIECSEDDANFTFFTEGEDLIIKGNLFIISKDKKIKSLELRFAIKRPIKEAFGLGLNQKKIAILYQNDAGLGTFGQKAIESFSKILSLNEGIDTFDCNQIPYFFENSKNYDILIITGDPENKVINSLTQELLMGCNQISKNYQLDLKNWVNEGGILWINGVDKNEGDNFDGSYLGAMGYSSVGWETISVDDPLGSLLNILENNREETADVNMPEHNVISCPHKLSEEFSKSTWFGNSLNTQGNADDVILGGESKSMLWTDHVGNGLIIFDEFILKDNLFLELPYNDDLSSRGLTEMYFTNVLNYISKLAYEQGVIKEVYGPKLIIPKANEKVEEQRFVFRSNVGNQGIYHLVVTDRKGISNEFILSPLNFGEKDELDGNSKLWSYYQNSSYYFLVVPFTENSWNSLENEKYEWQVGLEKEDYVVWSELGRFIKEADQNET